MDMIFNKYLGLKKVKKKIMNSIQIITGFHQHL